MADESKRIAAAPPAYVAPQTDLERRLAQLWEDVLGKKPVGRNDDFFALGGDSRQAIALIAKARKEGIDISELFQFPTIAGLLANEPDAAMPSTVVRDDSPQPRGMRFAKLAAIAILILAAVAIAKFLSGRVPGEIR